MHDKVGCGRFGHPDGLDDEGVEPGRWIVTEVAPRLTATLGDRVRVPVTAEMAVKYAAAESTTSSPPGGRGSR